MVAYESLIKFTTLGLIVVILFLILYFIKPSKRTEEWEHKILIISLFFAVHELSFFFGDAFIYQLTNILFIISLLYALLYVFSFERRLEEVKEQREELLKYIGQTIDMRKISEQVRLR